RGEATAADEHVSAGGQRARKHVHASLTVCLLIVGLAAPAHAQLTGGPQLAAVYNSILDARFTRAEGELKQACPPAPGEACQAVHAALLWWQIAVNPESRQLDRALEREIDQAIAVNETWTKREPQRAEAWFYLAGAYAPRVQWRILRGQRVAAAYDGKNIKEALERALVLQPGLADANFGLGLYHYYADVAPAAAKMLRWLL